jgi:hypothetical protein
VAEEFAFLQPGISSVRGLKFALFLDQQCCKELDRSQNWGSGHKRYEPPCKLYVFGARNSYLGALFVVIQRKAFDGVENEIDSLATKSLESRFRFPENPYRDEDCRDLSYISIFLLIAKCNGNGLPAEPDFVINFYE